MHQSMNGNYFFPSVGKCSVRSCECCFVCVRDISQQPLFRKLPNPSRNLFARDRMSLLPRRTGRCGIQPAETRVNGYSFFGWAESSMPIKAYGWDLYELKDGLRSFKVASSKGPHYSKFTASVRSWRVQEKVPDV